MITMSGRFFSISDFSFEEWSKLTMDSLTL